MSTVRLREAALPVEDGATTAGPSVPLAPLRVSGLVVRKADLIEALQVYVPGLVDLICTEDGAHYWLQIGERGAGDAAV